MAMPAHNKERDRLSDGGFIIIAVLWLLAALSCLVSAYTVYVVDSAVGMGGHEHRMRAEALASAAIELTAYRQLTIPLSSRPTHGQFNFRLERAHVEVTFQSEAARIDLN